jgi:hypothetical protein
MEFLNGVTNVSLSLNYFQISMLAILALLSAITFYKMSSKKPTGAFDLCLVLSIAVVLYLSKFFA